MPNFPTPLGKDGWAAIYNIDNLNSVVASVESGAVSAWSDELAKICRGEVLEIGCGSGASSLWLAKNGLRVTALDYTASSVELVKAAARKLALPNINVVLADATKPLPFKPKQFDYIFQAGLLEHFETEQQIDLLKNWAKYGKRIISMIPNAASLPYRIGKQIMENEGTWKYGLEIPKHSFAAEFELAGIRLEREYTLGTTWALKFLPKRHYIRKFFAKLEKDGFNLDGFMQGYLLVTIGNCG